MPDTDTIERRGKKHPEMVEEEIAQEAIVTVTQEAPREPVTDRRGNQLTFEGFEVEEVNSRIVGDLEVEENGTEYVELYETRRFEIEGKLLEVRQKDRKGTLVRIQHFFPFGPVVMLPGYPKVQPSQGPEEVNRKLAEIDAERERLADEE